MSARRTALTRQLTAAATRFLNPAGRSLGDLNATQLRAISHALLEIHLDVYRVLAARTERERLVVVAEAGEATDAGQRILDRRSAQRVRRAIRKAASA